MNINIIDFHVIHGVTGSLMFLTVIVHLLLHLAWNKSQLTHLFN